MKKVFLGVLALILGASATLIGAAPGQLDSTFSVTSPGITYGTLFRAVGSGGSAIAASVVIQENGAMVVGGTCASTVTGDGTNVRNRFCLQRYRAPTVSVTGSWTDPNFGTSGTGGTVITAPFTSLDATLSTIAVLPDGKILAAGTCPQAGVSLFCVVRYLASGVVDSNTGFGSAGLATLSVSNSADLVTMKIRPDGRILLIGNCVVSSITSFCMAQMLANGSRDTSFGASNSGQVISQGTKNRTATSALIRSDGSIVVAGLCTDIGSNFCVRRYTAAGAVDTTFASSGIADRTIHVSVGTGVNPTLSGGIVETATGKLLLSGRCQDNATGVNYYVFCTLRLLEDGTADLPFGVNGGFSNVMGAANSTPHAIAVQPDGKYVIVGECGNNGTIDFCAARYHSEGALDNSFDGDGIIGLLTNKTPGYALGLAIQPDGKPVLVGGCANGSQIQFCTVRLEGGPYGYRDCSMDIDADGKVMGLTDALIHARVTAGLSGDAVLNGVVFASGAKRTTWPAIRDYLGYHCGMRVLP